MFCFFLKEEDNFFFPSRLLGLSLEEFLNFVKKKKELQLYRNEIRHIFTAFDRHYRGYLTLEDFQKAFKQVAPKLPERIILEVFSILKMRLHCLLTCIVSDEKSAVIFTFSLLYLMCFPLLWGNSLCILLFYFILFFKISFPQKDWL
uniref:EF-hand calcium binding domain 11 n=1 Tax=Rousettus aegyptiacus TaxID=9407 RepID=A0A7J8IHP5_ROUAE|nr:EF-hand calcium binding domain 11 [Rousettus aegyptiacus]